MICAGRPHGRRSLVHAQAFSGEQWSCSGCRGQRLWFIRKLRALRCDTENVSGGRAGARLVRLVAPCAALGLYALWIRPAMLTWGATPEEAACRYACDELVPDPDGGATMAAVLPAPPEKVWPWLVQMGGGRGGWYSWDWLDNNGKPSADRIVPEWQSLDVGQQLKGPANRWTVVVVEPDQTLVLQSSYGLPRAVLPIRGSVPCPGRSWTGSGAFICVRLPAAGPVW